MKRLATAFLIAVLSVGISAPPAAEGDSHWHTPPHLWDEPRVYHAELDPEGADRLTLERVEATAPPEAERVLSPNRAYWYAWSRVPPETLRIHVFNERDGLIRIDWRGADPRYGPKLAWINEKLLYGEMWRGRVVGEFFVFDVEAEVFLAHEAVLDGTIAFRQWKEGCAAFPDIPACAVP